MLRLHFFLSRRCFWLYSFSREKKMQSRAPETKTIEFRLDAWHVHRLVPEPLRLTLCEADDPDWLHRRVLHQRSIGFTNDLGVGMTGRTQPSWKHWTHVGLMLSHCMRRWPNVKPMWGQCLMLARVLPDNRQEINRLSQYLSLMASHYCQSAYQS